jgi:hypothetical protein
MINNDRKYDKYCMLYVYDILFIFFLLPFLFSRPRPQEHYCSTSATVQHTVNAESKDASNIIVSFLVPSPMKDVIAVLVFVVAFCS